MSGPLRAILFVLISILALSAYGIGYHAGEQSVDYRLPGYLVQPVQRQPLWQLVAVPPYASDAWNSVAVGLSYRLAYEHARGLVPPADDVRGHPLPEPNGKKVCP